MVLPLANKVLTHHLIIIYCSTYEQVNQEVLK